MAESMNSNTQQESQLENDAIPLEPNIPENSSVPEDKPDDNTLTQPENKDFLDCVSDFFEKMVRGILIFAFYKFPKYIIKAIWNINYLKNFLIYTWKVLRITFWVTSWLLLILAGWIAFHFQDFLKFMRDTVFKFLSHIWAQFGYLIHDTYNYIVAHSGPIWLIIALVGSMYGLAYVTLKRIAKKRNKEFRGVFGFLKRKKKVNEGNSVV